MKDFVNSTFAIISSLVAVGTGWAIYAGVTQQQAFPMNPFVAIILGISVIVLDVSIGTLITDTYRFNQEARNITEREALAPVFPAWLLLVGAILGEVVLSLIIVVLKEIATWGVLVFPPLTVAGVFVTALRFDLLTREALRKEVRKERSTKGKANEKEGKQIPIQDKTLALETKVQKENEKVAQKADLRIVECLICHNYQGTPKQLAGHMRAHPLKERGNGKPPQKVLEEVGVVWTCQECDTINSKERESCRSCGVLVASR